MTLADVKMCSDCRHCGMLPGRNINTCAKRPDVRLRLAREDCGTRDWEEMPHTFGGANYERMEAEARVRDRETLIERLRDRAETVGGNDRTLLHAAADEIERLRRTSLPPFLARQVQS